MNHLFNQNCMVHRLTTTIEPPLNRPTQRTLDLGPFKCCVAQASGNEIMVNPQMAINRSLKVYLPIHSDIKNGDIIEVIGDYSYIVQNVYKPRNHHIECSVLIQEEL